MMMEFSRVACAGWRASAYVHAYICVYRYMYT